MKIVTAAAIAILVTFAFAILTLGRELLIPMVLAVFIWYLINIISDYISLLRIRGFALPPAVSFILALVVIIGSLTLFTNLISSSINNVIRTAPAYQENVEHLLARGAAMLGMDESPEIRQLVGKLDFSRIVQELGVTLAGFIGSAGLILIYTLFIFLEQKCFLPKIDHMVADAGQREKVRRILRRIYSDTKAYVGIKTFTSLLTAAISYAVMKAVSLDFALFWALLIFLFNYIPTIGSIVATLFPSVLALIQFPTLGPALVVVIGVTTAQMVVGNILEPRLMGDILNLSPLIILLSLALWGSLWGIPGAILCVPITVVAGIICSNFQVTRPVAILLSRNGEIRSDH